jgi:ribosomal protein S18 acetylase RimI-like enzyme
MIRRARHEDWGAVRDLLRELDELHAGLAPRYFRAAARETREWQQLLAADDGVVLVSTDDGPGAAVTGALSIRIYDTPPDPAMVPRRRGHVEMLVVKAAHRRRGQGRALMAEAAAWARARGAVEMVLTVWSGNREAEAFYQRLGYGVLSRVLAMPLG